MHPSSIRIDRARTAGAIACLAFAFAFPASGAEISAVVKDKQGRPVADAVVVAMPVSGTLPRLAPSATREIVDQVDSEFVPRVKTILAGSPVYFPNKDNIRHQVYSFSPAKTFELPLYAGTPAKPVLFDKPGVVVLGCNIHDWMIGYIYVSESPYFAKTGEDGRAQLRDLPGTDYTVRIWHPLLQEAEASTRQAAALGAASLAELSWSVGLKPELRIRRAPSGGGHRHY